MQNFGPLKDRNLSLQFTAARLSLSLPEHKILPLFPGLFKQSDQLAAIPFRQSLKQLRVAQIKLGGSDLHQAIPKRVQVLSIVIGKIQCLLHDKVQGLLIPHIPGVDDNAPHSVRLPKLLKAFIVVLRKVDEPIA